MSPITSADLLQTMHMVMAASGIREVCVDFACPYLLAVGSRGSMTVTAVAGLSRGFRHRCKAYGEEGGAKGP